MKKVGIGKNIAELRKSRKKTAEQLADALRVSRQTISKWENGETVPNADNVLDMATWLDVSIQDIYGHILADRIVRDAASKGKTKLETINELIMDSYSEGLDKKKNLDDAIAAFDRNFIPFDIKIGFNEIKYGDILRRFNTGYVVGIKESEYPVESQIIKAERFILPALVEYLSENGLLAFYCANRVVGEYEGAIIVITKDEHEILRFKELIKIFFIGLASFSDHRKMRTLYAEVVGGVKPKKRRFELAVFYSKDIKDEIDFDDSAMCLMSANTMEEVNTTLERFISLDGTIKKNFFEYASLGFGSDLIIVSDDEDKESLLIYDFRNLDAKECIPYKGKKLRPYDIFFVNDKTLEEEKSFNEIFLRYKSFDTEKELNAEVEKILGLDEESKKTLRKEYDNTNFMVVLNNNNHERAVYVIDQPKTKKVFVPDDIQRPKPLKIV